MLLDAVSHTVLQILVCACMHCTIASWSSENCHTLLEAVASGAYPHSRVPDTTVAAPEVSLHSALGIRLSV